MVFYGYICIGLVFMMDYDLFANINQYYNYLPVIGFALEYGIGFIANLVLYGTLAKNWEGYYNHKFL
jgi:hypothetical protein